MVKFFKKFGQKASSVAKFGMKVAKHPGFGLKKGQNLARKISHTADTVSNIATVGAAGAMAYGNAPLAAGLVGLSMAGAKVSNIADKARRTASSIEKVMPKHHAKPSPFEGGRPIPALPAPRQQQLIMYDPPAMAFESSAPVRGRGKR
jgi:hypothetical protein|tara:strand:+ start:464 stop:907 length:444 start_codon:yes stop_codon:yes gene_type:complete